MIAKGRGRASPARSAATTRGVILPFAVRTRTATPTSMSPRDGCSSLAGACRARRLENERLHPRRVREDVQFAAPTVALHTVLGWWLPPKFQSDSLIDARRPGDRRDAAPLARVDEVSMETLNDGWTAFYDSSQLLDRRRDDARPRVRHEEFVQLEPLLWAGQRLRGQFRLPQRAVRRNVRSRSHRCERWRARRAEASRQNILVLVRATLARVRAGGAADAARRGRRR